MRIAIDLDGTAFKWPREFSQLVLTLVVGGADVVFLTAAAGELPPQERPAEVARRVAKRLPLLTQVAIACVEECHKGDWLTAHGFDMIIDDKQVVSRTCLQLAPLD